MLVGIGLLGFWLLVVVGPDCAEGEFLVVYSHPYYSRKLCCWRLLLWVMYHKVFDIVDPASTANVSCRASVPRRIRLLSQWLLV